MTLGVFFALTDADVSALESCPDDDARLDLLREEIEERYFESDRDFVAECDKAWEAMHRALGDGSLTLDSTSDPLGNMVLGGQQLSENPDEIMSLKTADQVQRIAAAISVIDETEFRRRYGAIDSASYDSSPEDAEYSWEWFTVARAFYERAAAAGRPVLFTVSL